MKFSLAVVAAFLLLVSPIFANTLTVGGTTLAPVYANSNTSVNVLNLSLNVTENDLSVNLSAINITVVGGDIGNVSAVEIFNVTGFFVTSSSTNSTSSKFTVSFPNGFFVNESTNSSIRITLNISFSANVYTNISANISAGTEIGTSGSDTVTITGNSIQSKGVQLHSLHSRVHVSPNYVDTGVINQSFIYTFNFTGSEAVKNFSINLPSGYALSNVTAVEAVGTGNLSSSLFTNMTRSNQINISLNTPSTNTIKIYFLANTSSSTVASAPFTSFINADPTNLTDVAGEERDAGATNVTTQPLLNISTVRVIKGTAVVNGTDFWEFNLTFNYTATLPRGGIIQFKLSNWTENGGTNLSLTGCSTNCATLRTSTDFSAAGKFNLTNDYETLIKGTSVSSTTQSSLVTVILRMVIPGGTASSSTWQSTYGILFRANT